MSALNGEVERLEAAHRRLAAARAGLRGVASDPAGTSTGSSGEHDWSAGEVLAHVSEFVPYWQGEIERILAGSTEPSAPPPFGRIATDPVRIAIVDRDRTLPFEELLSRISSSVDRASRRLVSLDERAAGRTGLHPRFGEMTVREIVERFMVTHMEEHAEQLERVAGRG
jgi:hypothetical protein